MLFKSVPVKYVDALSTFYIWVDTKQTCLLQGVKEHIGETAYQYLLCAYVTNDLEPFARLAEIPIRSGRVLLPLLAEQLDLYMHKNKLM